MLKYVKDGRDVRLGKIRLRTADLDETIDAVTRIYCPHSVRVLSANGRLSSELEVSHAGPLRIRSTRIGTDTAELTRIS